MFNLNRDHLSESAIDFYLFLLSDTTFHGPYPFTITKPVPSLSNKSSR